MILRASIRLRGGFTIIEMLISTAMMTAVMGAILTVVSSAQATFQAQGEVTDEQQRLRATVDMMTTDLRMAGGSDASVRPYRVGSVRDDAEAGVYYRPDAISVFSSASATHTYYLRPAAGLDTFELVQYDGRQSDLPVIDHVVSLAFEYFGDPRAPERVVAGDGPAGDPVELGPAILADGPWWHDASGRTFDADLVRLRDVGVTLRVRSALGSPLVPDQQIEFHVALRNMMAGM